jgi:hypothetical protein
MRRTAAHALALRCRGISGVHPCADINLRQAVSVKPAPNAGKRNFEVAMNIVR